MFRILNMILRKLCNFWYNELKYVEIKVSNILKQYLNLIIHRNYMLL